MLAFSRHNVFNALRNAGARTPLFVAHRSMSVKSGAGTLLTQGRGVFGSLGQGTKLLDSPVYKPTVAFDANNESCDGQRNVALAAAGWGHSAVLNTDGQLYVFGRPYDFSIIMRIDKIYKFSKWMARYISASSNSMFFGNTVGYFPSPTRIETDEKIVDLTCSAGLTVFLTESGDIYSFGLNRWGQCGVASEENAHLLQPTKVAGVPSCTKIDSGLQHCIALTTDGEVYTWGKANKGQLGTVADLKELPLTALPAVVPLEVPLVSHKGGKQQGRSRSDNSPTNVKATSISAGFAHSAALTSDGHVYVWGKGMATEYKDKNFVAGSMKVCEDQLTPRKLILPGNRRAVEICSSNFHLVILAEDGSLWAVGMGELDRNANPEPLRVQTDFHPILPAGNAHSTANNSRARAEVDPADGKPYLLVPTASTVMRKGHQRVSLVIDEPLSELPAPSGPTATADSVAAAESLPSTSNRDHFPDQGIYEVVVHGGEAYLIEMVLPMGTQDHKYKLVGFSGGWRHSLMVVQHA